MKFNLSQINYSRKDIRRELSLPNKLTEELAEFLGIMVGDGHLHCAVGEQINGGPLLRSNIVISGNINEKEYHDYVMNLFNRIFNTTFSYKKDNACKAALLKAYSKAIVQFLHKICGLPITRKDDIRIPEIISGSSDNIKCAFIRGLADTDFCLTFKNKTIRGHSYPVIKASFKSKQLVQDVEFLLNELGFNTSTYYDEHRFDKRTLKTYILNNIYLNGEKNLKIWIKKIGFSNPKYHVRIKKWKKDGVCPPGYYG